MQGLTAYRVVSGVTCTVLDMFGAQVRPDGSGLRRVFDSHGGLANHPKFSPKFTPEAGRIVFTSDYAGYSAEEIALPHQFQPYGDLFAINIDGTGLQRLTHGGFGLLRMRFKRFAPSSCRTLECCSRYRAHWGMYWATPKRQEISIILHPLLSNEALLNSKTGHDTTHSPMVLQNCAASWMVGRDRTGGQQAGL